uniref:ATP-dependent Clp protease proteolytic subunit 1 n=1 Tax=Silene graminifolia TaxID=1309618 RepID=UPI0027A87504|nr:ATP-dependent Clp protease proteolytic subunit 1 [Silene graminifolia]WFF47603.1 ATP-dependent Clp protease proteolytic subunit 1 [Silene graminifolia]
MIEWIDIYSALYQHRQIFLFDQIRDDVAQQIPGLLLYLSADDPTKDLNLFINSPGGNVTHGLSIYNMMQFVDADVSTTCVGEASSIAALILAGGEINKRYAFPHARVMLQQPSGSYNMHTSFDVIRLTEEMLHFREQIANAYVERTGQPYETIYRDMKRSKFMSAEEVKEYGIIDRIVNRYNKNKS